MPVSSFWPVVRKLSNLSEVTFITESPKENCAAFIVRSAEFFIPLEGKIDAEKERESLQKELEYNQGFIASIDKKLSNEKFINSAPPQVVEMERKKKADAENKVRAIEERLGRL
jgi:valyl-tRNA synthetase